MGQNGVLVLYQGRSSASILPGESSRREPCSVIAYCELITAPEWLYTARNSSYSLTSLELTKIVLAALWVEPPRGSCGHFGDTKSLATDHFVASLYGWWIYSLGKDCRVSYYWYLLTIYSGQVNSIMYAISGTSLCFNDGQRFYPYKWYGPPGNRRSGFESWVFIPYSPDYNPIELSFKDLMAQLRKNRNSIG